MGTSTRTAIRTNTAGIRHFGGGRYREDQQQRMGTLARMGAVCVDYDLFGWGESAFVRHQNVR